MEIKLNGQIDFFFQVTVWMYEFSQNKQTTQRMINLKPKKQCYNWTKKKLQSIVIKIVYKKTKKDLKENEYNFHFFINVVALRLLSDFN